MLFDPTLTLTIAGAAIWGSALMDYAVERLAARTKEQLRRPEPLPLQPPTRESRLRSPQSRQTTIGFEHPLAHPDMQAFVRAIRAEARERKEGFRL
jgi:hypothetical protein